jgi:hypothetical protein
MECRYCPKPCATCGGDIPHRCTWCEEREPGSSEFCWITHRHRDDPVGTYPRRFLVRDARYAYCSPTCANEGRVRARRLADERRRRSACATCNTPLPIRSGATYCSNACRQRAYRRRKSYAEAIAMAREAFAR